MLFENIAASILQRLDREAEIDESVSAGPYFFNENYGKQDLRETYEPETMTNQDDLADDEGALISKHVEIAAQQILDGYTAGKDKINPEKLIYITDEDLLSAISRKTTQLHALLKSCYDKDIAKEHIEQAIRRQIKYLAYNA
jgi:hypothetical protein